MEHQSCLAKRTEPFVIDASVAINLFATQCAERIIEPISNQILMPDVVLEEIEKGEGDNLHQYLTRNSDSGSSRLRIVRLSSTTEESFTRLVSGRSVNTLDDGEAATIAHALACGGIALIDEQKATRVARERFPGLPTASTIDLFRHPEVEDSMTTQELSAAVFAALRDANMSVPSAHLDWVVSLVGRERLSLCLSLPRRVREV